MNICVRMCVCFLFCVCTPEYSGFSHLIQCYISDSLHFVYFSAHFKSSLHFCVCSLNYNTLASFWRWSSLSFNLYLVLITGLHGTVSFSWGWMSCRLRVSCLQARVRKGHREERTARGNTVKHHKTSCVKSKCFFYCIPTPGKCAEHFWICTLFTLENMIQLSILKYLSMHFKSA